MKEIEKEKSKLKLWAEGKIPLGEICNNTGTQIKKANKNLSPGEFYEERNKERIDVLIENLDMIKDRVEKAEKFISEVNVVLKKVNLIKFKKGEGSFDGASIDEMCPETKPSIKPNSEAPDPIKIDDDIYSPELKEAIEKGAVIHKNEIKTYISNGEPREYKERGFIIVPGRKKDKKKKKK